ncbi:MAG TPA: SH3 domain-containing protein [Thermomicrobiaceae bacterium]|nr:SH3 domain-containing protein [Thermomicrobiaceae bacterium]
MVEPGLTTRLRQHSRRSGMLVGFSMLVTIIILVATFIWIYVRMGPLLSDFIPSQSAAAAATPVSQVVTAATPGAGTPVAAAELLATPSPTPAAVWQATHRVAPGGSSSGPNVYFRSGPSTSSAPVTALAPGTELKFLGKTQPDGNVTWMQFERQDGSTGWIRNVDVVAIKP